MLEVDPVAGVRSAADHPQRLRGAARYSGAAQRGDEPR